MCRSLIIDHLQILFLVHIKHLQPQSQCFLIQNQVLDFDQKIISHKQRIFLRTPFHLGQLQNPPCQTQKTYENEHIYRQYKLIFELISFVSLNENMLVVLIHMWTNNILALKTLFRLLSFENELLTFHWQTAQSLEVAGDPRLSFLLSPELLIVN